MKKGTPRSNAIRVYTIEEIMLAADSKHSREFNIFNNENLRIEPEISIPFRLDHYTVILVTSGILKMRLNLVEYDIPANSLLLFAPNVIAEFLNDFRKCAFTAIDFTITLLTEAALNKKYMDGFGVYTRQHMPVHALLPEEVHNIKTIMDQLSIKNNLPKDHPFIGELLINLFKVLFFEIASVIHKKFSGKQIQLNSKEVLVKKFYAELTTHFKNRREVDFYAEKLNVTPKYLTKCVKEILGKSTSEVITQMVIAEAKIMLSNLSDPISKIAGELAFSDQFFFSKFFKRATGISPSEYRGLLWS
ncbi:AraC family transcriptional regulator [Chitinophaga silvisoli]|uniref:AraC family transcriptional regulator n=1 Tax=Chitinophaga silvisoli TaxID=2291814 RepID=A0A3E1NXL1_9BACT|nr:helix-turn-helix transcriptional regulator [Chitinophaga silvisoli]RFM32661.1 AraC family transcriptional regulator [Chitinophaga silvisoli]